MISKFLKNFDIFAQPFQFNTAKQSQRKRTQGLSESYQTQTYSNEEHQGQIFVPSIIAKQQELTLNSKTNIRYNNKFQDEIKECVISEFSTQQSPKSKIIINQNFNLEKNILQPQIGKKERKRYRSQGDNNMFKNNNQEYQYIQKGIEILNSQTSKIQNIQAESKVDDLSKKQNLLNGINSRIDNQQLSKKIEDKLFNLKQIYNLLIQKYQFF
ncbi:hypothetical protein ABPG73_009887 [Tetrahymena malaccensis]